MTIGNKEFNPRWVAIWMTFIISMVSLAGVYANSQSSEATAKAEREQNKKDIAELKAGQQKAIEKVYEIDKTVHSNNILLKSIQKKVNE